MNSKTLTLHHAFKGSILTQTSLTSLRDNGVKQ